MKYLLFIFLVSFLSPSTKDKLTDTEEFIINGGTYDIDIVVIVSNDLIYVKERCEKLGITTDSSYFDTRAVTLYEYGYPIIVWFPKDCKDRSIVNHEIFHVTNRVLEWAGVSIDSNSEEAYAFELQ